MVVVEWHTATGRPLPESVNTALVHALALVSRDTLNTSPAESVADLVDYPVHITKRNEYLRLAAAVRAQGDDVNFARAIRETGVEERGAKRWKKQPMFRRLAGLPPLGE